MEQVKRPVCNLQGLSLVRSVACSQVEAFNSNSVTRYYRKDLMSWFGSPAIETGSLGFFLKAFTCQEIFLVIMEASVPSLMSG